MKKQIKRLGLGIASISLLIAGSCDRIEPPYVVPAKHVACEAPDFPAIGNTYKRVLLEDFTGHTCTNCPDAAEATHQILMNHADHVVAVAIHANYFAKPLLDPDFTYDFRTPQGEYWYTYFGVATNPIGMINRVTTGGQILYPYSQWENKVTEALAGNPLVEIQIIPQYNPLDDTLCVHTKTTFLGTYSHDLYLSVLLTEDSIVQPQKKGANVVLDYVHNHALRAVLNGNWGTLINYAAPHSNDTFAIESFSEKFSHLNANPMVMKNCHIVAFVFDGETKEVLQVTQVKLID